MTDIQDGRNSTGKSHSEIFEKKIQKPQHPHVSSNNWAKWTDPKP